MSEQTPRQENILGTQKVSKLLVQFAVPGIVSMVVNSFYNIVDQIFIGRGVGYLGNGATNVIFPMTTLALAFSLMAGNGAGSYMSLMLGRKQEDEAARGTAAGMVASVFLGIMLAVIYFVFITPLAKLFGATDAILPYAVEYGRIIALGMPFSCISSGFSSIVRSDGSPKYNMAGLLMGCAINIILDPIFIFVLHWGVAGAAWATIIGQFANAVLMLLYIPRFKSVKVTRSTLSTCGRSLRPVLNLGTSSFISQFVVVIAMAVQNNIMVIYGATSKYGAEIPMTALGVTMKVFSILMAIVMGLATGSQPILGYNYGARRFDRVKQCFRYDLCIGIGVMTFAFILFHVCPEAIIGIFGNESDLYNEFSVKCLQIFLMMIPLGAVQMVSGVFFQAVGRPVQSSLISLSKQIVFQIPFSLILPIFIGVEGVLWAGACSDLLSCLLCLILLKKYWNKLFEETAPQAAAAPVHTGRGGFLGDGQVAAEGAPNVIITIGRTYGAGGRTVARKLAQELGLPYYDGEILQQASQESGLDAQYMQHVNESARSYKLVYSLVPLRDPGIFGMESLCRAADEAQSEIIQRAAQGPCIIVGRRADQVLKDRPNLLRVFVTEEENLRAGFVARKEKITEEEALKKIADTDRNRANYYGELGGKTWGHAGCYDLCVNTGTLGLDGAVQLIREAVQSRVS